MRNDKEVEHCRVLLNCIQYVCVYLPRLAHTHLRVRTESLLSL